ncbi:hypothetical protein RND81_O264200 [Saponaria officinalis]|uniref:Uncharacterized protein n=1 Tax=Saponaria officinalis TaxID=3572 RepID=A0AAW1GL05_SAPOF
MPLNPPPIKIGPGRPRKNRRKDPFEDPKKKGRLTKHGIEMTCSLCKSKTHNKRKCPNKGKSLPTPPPKRARGRPKAAHNLTGTETVAASQSVVASESVAEADTHHQLTAQPTRVGRGGRVISSGRGSRGKATAKGGRRGGRAPQGFGVLYDNQGTPFTNVPGDRNGNTIPVPQAATTSGPSTQVSVNKNP